jgi:hypothetical protein
MNVLRMLLSKAAMTLNSPRDKSDSIAGSVKSIFCPQVNRPVAKTRTE